jgi:predicted RecA/RadA family phage recombinase
VAVEEGDRIAVLPRDGRVAEKGFFSLPQFLAKAMRKTRYAYLDKNSKEQRDAQGQARQERQATHPM